MKFEAALFDLDGTLLDTLRDLAESMNRALASLGYATHPVEQYRTMVGDGVEVLARRVLPENRRDARFIAELGAAYRADYDRNWAVHTAPYAGIVQLLEDLRTQGIRTAVLSNKPHSYTVRCVERFVPDGRFEIVLGAGSQFPHKPDPAGALHIATQMKIAPGRFLYLGDTNTDMHTAVSAGMYPVGVTWGFRERAELVEAGAKTIIDRPGELLAILSG